MAKSIIGAERFESFWKRSIGTPQPPAESYQSPRCAEILNMITKSISMGSRESRCVECGNVDGMTTSLSSEVGGYAIFRRRVFCVLAMQGSETFQDGRR